MVEDESKVFPDIGYELDITKKEDIDLYKRLLNIVQNNNLEATPDEEPSNVLTVVNNGDEMGKTIKKGDFRLIEVLDRINTAKKADPISLTHKDPADKTIEYTVDYNVGLVNIGTAPYADIQLITEVSHN
jgi:hypothetical protein